MDTRNIILLLLSIGTVILLGALPVFRTWWRGVFVYPFSSFLFFALFAGVLFLDAARSPGDTALLDPLRIARVVVYIIITGLAWTSLLLQKSSARINKGVIFMLVFALAAMLTSIYSVYSSLTLWKAFEVVTHVSVAAVLARNVSTMEDAERVLGLAWIALLYVLVSVVWGALLFPDEAFRAFTDPNTGKIISSGAFSYGLKGIFPPFHLNSTTQISAILALVATSYLVGRHKMKVRVVMLGLLCTSLIAMVLAHSRTSIFGLTLAFTAIALYARSRGVKIAFFASALLVLASGAILTAVTHYLLRGQSEEVFSHMTGRVDFWEQVLPYVFRSPLFGYGYYAATRVMFHVPGTDNTYLTILLGGGIILLTLFLIPIIIVMWHLFDSRPGRLGKNLTTEHRLVWIQTVGLFTLLFVRSTTGPSFDANHYNLILFLVCTITASVLHRARRDAAHKKVTAAPQANPAALKRQPGHSFVRPMRQKIW